MERSEGRVEAGDTKNGEGSDGDWYGGRREENETLRTAVWEHARIIHSLLFQSECEIPHSAWRKSHRFPLPLVGFHYFYFVDLVDLVDFYPLHLSANSVERLEAIA